MSRLHHTDPDNTIAAIVIIAFIVMIISYGIILDHVDPRPPRLDVTQYTECLRMAQKMCSITPNHFIQGTFSNSTRL